MSPGDQLGGARPDVLVARLAGADRGVLSVTELRACGLSDTAISGRVRRGWLHRLHRGVYAVGHPNVPLEGRFLAAVKACGPGAALSHVPAAVLWGFLDWEERLIDVTVPGAYRSHAGLRIHRSGRLTALDVARFAGVPVTTPARTLLDLAGVLPAPALRAVVRRAQGMQRVNVEQLVAALARLRPCRGASRLAAVIATGPAPTRSLFESVVLDLLAEGGLRPPEVNRPLWIGGRKVIPDFRWPAERLVLEADSAAWHDNPIAREEDAERQALLEANGERVIRVTWTQAMTRRPQTLARLLAAGAPI